MLCHRINKIRKSNYWDIAMILFTNEKIWGQMHCQKYLVVAPSGLLQSLNLPEQFWEEISMDFIIRLPKSKRYASIFVVVDRLTKWNHFIPLKHPYSTILLVEVFIKEVSCLHGIPILIVSDRDPIFLSSFWKELFKLQGTQLKMSTTYHPQRDGQTKVVNRCLETFLQCFIVD